LTCEWQSIRFLFKFIQCIARANPFFTIPAFYPKAVDVFIRQVFWLVLFYASFPNCFSGYIAWIAFGNELTATGIAPDLNGIPF
jgi:hypothetical protein